MLADYNSILANGNVWIGLQRYATNGNFTWRRSGLQLQHSGTVKSVHWYHREPNGPEEFCVFIHAPNQKLYDKSCEKGDGMMATACEIPYTIEINDRETN